MSQADAALKWKRDADGRHVAWVTQATLADWLGITTRWVQKLEERGLPATGHRDSCRYPVPDALIWYIEYQAARVRAGLRQDPPPATLSLALALARYRRSYAIENAELDFLLATDVAFRERFEKLG